MISRLRTYLAEMFPPSRRVPEALLLYGSLSTVLSRLHGRPGALLSLETLRGGATAALFLLMLRLMDELKDAEVDRELFPERALPSGRVHGSDLRAALGLTLGAFLALHAGLRPAFLTALGMLAYALLMFRWFFAPERLRRSLPLTLATHTPVVPLLVIHLSVLWATTHGVPLGAVRLTPVATVVLAYWAGALAWELARKTRAAGEETAYVTYSRLLGRPAAVAAAGVAQLVSIGAALGLVLGNALAWRSATILCGAGLLVVAGQARFLLRPRSGSGRLRRFAEGQLVALFAAFLLS